MDGLRTKRSVILFQTKNSVIKKMKMKMTYKDLTRFTIKAKVKRFVGDHRFY